MVNSWSLLFDELNMTKHSTHYYDYTRNDPDRKNPFTKADGYSVNGESNQDFWKEDGFSLIGNPGSASSDTISFSSAYDALDIGDPGPFAAQPVPMIFGASGEDTLTFNLDMPKNNKYKYSEDVILKELTDYIAGTYNQHYSAGDDKIQTLDLIEACGDGESFCRSNILKYASRYDKKGTARRDIMKILHYAVLLMHFNDKNAQSEPYPQ